MTAAALLEALGPAAPLAGGYVTAVRGLLAEADAPALPIGALAELETCDGMRPAEVVGFRDGRLQLMPLAPMRGIAPGCRVWPRADVAAIPCGDFLLGRVIDPLGRASDGAGALPQGSPAPLYRASVQPLERPVLSQPLGTGVRAIDAAAALARGQRVGLFAGAGVGKSTLLGMLVRGTSADVRVIGLVGERGREVREFVEREIGPARSRTVVVAVPSDAPPLLRTRGAWAATAVAEWFRDRGLDVLLVMDSLTRFAMAAREIGLARGEPATTKGYTPSVFVELPQLLERAGRLAHGSITGVYSVLVEGNDLADPVADALVAILDGHIVLSRDLAERGHYPAIDVLASVSRAMPAVAARAHRDAASKLRRLLAAHRDSEDLIQVGAYKAGSDAAVDEAIARRAALEAFLRQDTAEVTPLAEAVAGLRRAVGEAA